MAKEAPGGIVQVEMVRRDRASFDEWWPAHLASVYALADAVYFRVDPETSADVLDVFARAYPNGAPRPTLIETQFDHFGRFQEDAERQELLRWALASGAEWAVCLDADEVIEPGGAEALRALLLGPRARTFRLVRVILTYSSHHRPGWVLPRGGFQPWRAFRLDRRVARYVYRSDADGLHCGSVPSPAVGSITLPDLRVLHYHATTPAEYMAEREFYAGTVEVEKHGGIDHLYRCDRFGDEREAVPLEVELAGAEERLARVAAGKALRR